MRFLDETRETSLGGLIFSGILVIIVVSVQSSLGDYFTELFSLPTTGPDPTHSSFIPWALFTLAWGAFVWWIIVIGVGFVRIAGLSFRDIGIRRIKIYDGGIFLVLLWSLTQLGLGIDALAHDSIALSAIRLSEFLYFIVGLVALITVEEVVFRGFFLPQVYLKYNRWIKGRGNKKKALVAAILTTSLYFSLLHIPSASDFSAGSLLLRIVMIALYSSFFAVIYLWTRNIFVATGVHVLINNPMAIIIGNQLGHFFYVTGMAIILVAIWPFVQNKTLARFSADLK